MKNLFNKIIWLIAIVFMAACSMSVNAPTAPVATIEFPTLPAPSATNAVISGMDVSYFGISFTIPAVLANGTQNDIVPQSNDSDAPFDIHPAYIRFILQGYPLQGTAFKPQVLIYPVKEFSQKSEGAATTIHNLQNIMAIQRALSAEPLPFLPNQNAQQVLRAQEKFLSFKNGTGIRYITQYDQAPLPINNKELFYTFQGITSDAFYYVSVIMPVNLPYLTADSNVTSPIPADSVPFNWENPELFPSYLTAITDRLNQTNNPFNPALEPLDSLVESLLAVGQK